MPKEEREFSNEVRKQALKWRILIDNDELELPDRTELDAWLQADPLHARALDRAETVLSAFAKLDERVIRPDHIKQSLLDRTRYFLSELKEKPIGFIGGASLALACTAMLALGIVVFIRFLGPPNYETVRAPAVVAVYQTGLSETDMIRLTDESVVTIGPGTHLEVSYTNQSRTVVLEKGAAVFEVISDADRPFTVKAEDFSARVLGTTFDVRNNGGVVRLSVLEGVVEARHPFVIDNTATSMISRSEIKAGESIIATGTDGLATKKAFKAESFAAWRDDRLRYNGATLNELVADANRYSSIPIVIESAGSEVAELRATFTYDGRELETMLASLPNLFPVIVDRSEEDLIKIRAADDG